MATRRGKSRGRKSSATAQAPSVGKSAPMESLINPGVTSRSPRLARNATTATNGVYEKGFSTSQIMGSKLTHATLRRVSKNSGLVQAILSRRDFQMAQISKKWKYEGDVGFRVVHEQHHEQDFQVPDGFKELSKDMENMIVKPWGYLEPTFGGFSSKYLKDLMIINRPCIEVGMDTRGIPRSFGMIDGANVYPTFKVLADLVAPSLDTTSNVVLEPNSQKSSNALQAISEKYNINLDDQTEYIYMEDLVPISGYRHDQLILSPMMPETDVSNYGYPPSMVERAIKMICAELMAMGYNMDYFQFGSMVDSIIGVVGSVSL